MPYLSASDAPGTPILFLSDFGYEDEYAGACRAVAERFAPGVRVIDLTHGIAPGDVRRGALALAAATERSGPAVYLAVVDPGVGTERRGLALRAGDCFLVGPDNGLLTLAAERLGGVAEAADITGTPLRLEPVAPTFHGRDVFTPVAAHLAAGRPLRAAGEPLDGEPVALELPQPRREGEALIAHVLYLDRFGNAILDAAPEELAGASAMWLEGAGESRELPVVRAFGEVEPGAAALFTDSSGRLGLAVNGGSAAARFALERDTEVRLLAR